MSFSTVQKPQTKNNVTTKAMAMRRFCVRKSGKILVACRKGNLHWDEEVTLIHYCVNQY
jgi:hypothetical protein